MTDETSIDTQIFDYKKARDEILRLRGRVGELETTLDALKDAAFPPVPATLVQRDPDEPPVHAYPQTVSVDREEFECFVAVRRLLQEAANA